MTREVETSRTTQPTLHLRFLGGPEIRLGEQVIHLETVKTVALLAYLAVRPGPHQRDLLADLLWGEQGQARAARSLRRALWNIRHSLCSGDDEDTCPYLTVTRRDVAFNHRSPHTLDLKTFEEHINAAQEVERTAGIDDASAASALRHLSECVRLYRGDFLEGVCLEDAPTFETWLLGERAYYRERVLQALSRLSEIYAARGEYERAILALQRLLALAPWSEWGHRQLMFCYALAGRRADALAQYERCRRVLREELNADPLPETVALYERIRNPREFTRILYQADRPLSPAGSAPLLEIPFLGRGEEHAWLLVQWDRRDKGLALVEGEAGVGKTRLVEEVLRHLSGKGHPVLRGRCHQFGSSIPYQPITDALRDHLRQQPRAFARLQPVWLAELSHLLPELRVSFPDLPPPVPIEKSSVARQRLFEAVAQALLSVTDAGLAFFLDDAHWADPDSVDMLRYLLHRLEGSPIWFVAAYRKEELEPGHPFLLLHRDLASNHRVSLLRLKPLGAATIKRLVSHLEGLPPEEAHFLASYLLARSRGNPFILIETLRDLVDRGVLRREAEGWRARAHWLKEACRLTATATVRIATNPHPLPAAVAQMIMARVERLPSPARDLIGLIAVLGEPFTRDMLHALANTTPHDADTALTHWITRGLVRALSAERSPHYDFTHPLIREAVYRHLPLHVRQTMHAQIAEELEALYAGKEEQILEALASHYAESGRRDKAIHYLLRAGESMQARQAQEAAIHFFTRALEFIPTDDMLTRYRALGGRERAYNQLGRRREQAQDLAAMGEIAAALDNPAYQTEVLYRRAEWAMRTAQFRRGIADAQAAQQLARTHNLTGLAIDALRIESMCHVRLGDFVRAREPCLEALRLSRKVGDRRREVLALGTLGIIDLDQDRVKDAREHMEAALAYWQETNDIWRQAIACNNLSMLYHRLGDYGRALELQQEARRLIPRTGSLGLDAYSLTSLGVLYFTVGRYEDARQCYEQALDLARIISDRGFESYTLSCMGEVLLGLGNIEDAESAFRQALAIEEEMDIRFHRPQIWEGLARCALAQGNLDEAHTRLRRAEGFFENERYPGHPLALALHAYVETLRGARESARELLCRFEEKVQETDDREETEPEAWWLVSQAYEALEEPEAARAALITAYNLIQLRASTLDENNRRLYLHSVPAHRAVLARVEGG